MTSIRKPKFKKDHPSNVVLENAGDNQDQEPTTTITSNVAGIEDMFDNQIPTVAVLSCILLVLLICLSLILCWLYRRRPNRSVKRASTGVNKAKTKGYDNEASEKLGKCASDVNELDAGGKHTYETLDECTHVYKNLVVHDKIETEHVDVFEATCNDITVDECSTLIVPLDIKAPELADSYNTQTVPTDAFGDDEYLVMAAKLPSNRESESVDVDMPECAPKFNSIQRKRFKRKKVGSFYPKQHRPPCRTNQKK